MSSDHDEHRATPRVELTDFEVEHLPRLADWLRQPHVAPWYPEPSDNLAWARHPPHGAGHALITADYDPVGYVRWQAVDRETLDSVGLTDIPAGSVDIDILIGDRKHTGCGVGVTALRMLVDQLRVDAAVPFIGLTTSVDNTHAQSAFRKAGFRFDRHYAPEGFGECCLMVLKR